MAGRSPDRDQSATLEPPDGGGRLVFVDVLRVAVIVGVVAHHAAQAYGPTGGEWVLADQANSRWFEPFYLVNAAFGMGLLFLLAGYFVPKAYDRKGAGRFLKERWLRVGVPMTIFILVVHLPIVYLLEEPRLSAGDFVRSLYDGGWMRAYSHLWFLGHLLLYSAGYVVWRWIVDRRPERPRKTWLPPGHAAIVGFVIGLALITWVVRWSFPIDEWVPLFFIVAAEPAHLPQYVSLFAVGAVAYRGDWLRRLPTGVGATWLGVGLVAAAGVFASRLLPDERLDDFVTTSGSSWQSLLYSTWEALICVGLVLGMIVFSRAMFRRPNRLLVAMVAGSYAAYILHLAIVIGLQLGLEGVDLPAFVKFGLVTAIGVLLAFGIAHLSRRVPGLRTILGTTPGRVERPADHRELQM